jgi:hypothetical protein
MQALAPLEQGPVLLTNIRLGLSGTNTHTHTSLFVWIINDKEKWGDNVGTPAASFFQRI